MLRKLLVDQVSYGGVALPPQAEVVLTWRSVHGQTSWSAIATLPGAVQVPETGPFVARAATGAVAGEAAATTTVDDESGVRTTIRWEGRGELSLPD